MNLKKGIKLLEEIEGDGEPASKGDFVRFKLLAYLNKGEEIPINRIEVLDAWPDELILREDNNEFINFSCQLGKRRNIAAIEYSLYGMKPGGYRKIKASPHLAYGLAGVPGKVPENAVIIFEIWLRELTRGT